LATTASGDVLVENMPDDGEPLAAALPIGAAGMPPLTWPDTIELMPATAQSSMPTSTCCASPLRSRSRSAATTARAAERPVR
jgi:hypothetical protein